MKVYPVTEPSMNLLKTNSKNSSIQYAVAAFLLSAGISIIIDYLFSDKTPVMTALVIVGPAVCFLCSGVQYISGRRSIRDVNDEWERLEKKTIFPTLDPSPK